MVATGGFLAEHMAFHLVLMNIVAPTVVMACRLQSRHAAHGSSIAAASVAQILVLWGWHLPPALGFAMSSNVAMALMHLSLFAVALAFWRAVIGAAAERRWQAIGGVLMTGKLFCLLGVLLTFAPRPLYSAAVHAVHAPASSNSVPALADQQLAGLLMLIACPLTYVLAGIVIAAKWISEIERRPAWSPLSERR